MEVGAAAIDAGTERPVARTALVQALEHAEASVLAELNEIPRLLRRATEAASTGRHELADEVAADANAMERSYADAHDQLIAAIARQAPVACDLRLATALLHVNDRVARMAAQCRNIATLCCAVPAPERPSTAQLDCLQSMARLVDAQVTDAAKVFAKRDLHGARALCEHDLRINEHNRRCFELAVQHGTTERKREVAFCVALMARALERMGDNAIDIGQQAMFAATGESRLTPLAGHPRTDRAAL